jgi:hypothetical protein
MHFFAIDDHFARGANPQADLVAFDAENGDGDDDIGADVEGFIRAAALGLRPVEHSNGALCFPARTIRPILEFCVYGLWVLRFFDFSA